jgi:colanic acid biosynthesis protein WcaH
MISALIAELEQLAAPPEAGLGEELFLLVSRLTPMINVDLLIKDATGHTLLTWRDDEFYGPGWHVPGGIIRYRESFADRIHAVARNELKTSVSFEKTPIAIHEVISPAAQARGHHISMLYRCHLQGPLDETLRFTPGAPMAGQWEWHGVCPGNLIPEQSGYAAFMR